LHAKIIATTVGYAMQLLFVAYLPLSG